MSKRRNDRPDVARTLRHGGKALYYGLLLGAVLLAKLIVVFQLHANPLLQSDAGLDTTAYFNLAQRVIGGDLALGPGLYYVTPLYIYFLAAALAITNSLAAVRVLQTLLGTGAVWCVFVACRAWFGERPAWIAALLAGLTGLFTFYEVLILQASLDTVLTAGALACLALGLTGRSGRWLFAAGVVFGLQTLNRPNVLAAAVGIIILLVIARHFRMGLLIAVGLIAALVPVGVRNIVVSHQWSLVASHGGLNLYIGNNENATGFFRVIPGIRPNIEGQVEDAHRVAEHAVGHKMTDEEVSGYFTNLALSWMRQHPLAAARLYLKKVAYVFNAQHISHPFSYPFYAYDMRTLLALLAIGPWILLPLGLVGLVVGMPASKERRIEYAIWASFVPLYALSVAVFIVSERYRLPLLVPLCIGGGVAIDLGWEALQTRKWRPLAIAGLAFVLLFTGANWPTSLDDGRAAERVKMAERLISTGQYDEAEQWATRAATSLPAVTAGALHYSVGMQYMTVHQTQRALSHFEKADALAPGNRETESALGQALLDAGDYQNAVSPLQRAMAGGSDTPMVALNLATAQKAVGDIPGALATLRKISPEADADAEVWLDIGRMAAGMNAPDVAESYFRRAVTVQPDLATARLELGEDLIQLRRYEEAERELAEAARLNPADADSRSDRALCLVKIGRIAEAHAAAQDALRLNPSDEVALQILASTQ